MRRDRNSDRTETSTYQDNDLQRWGCPIFSSSHICWSIRDGGRFLTSVPKRGGQYGRVGDSQRIRRLRTRSREEPCAVQFLKEGNKKNAPPRSKAEIGAHARLEEANQILGFGYSTRSPRAQRAPTAAVQIACTFRPLQRPV